VGTTSRAVRATTSVTGGTHTNGDASLMDPTEKFVVECELQAIKVCTRFGIGVGMLVYRAYSNERWRMPLSPEFGGMTASQTRTLLFR
jgi:hypothetical protein